MGLSDLVSKVKNIAGNDLVKNTAKAVGIDLDAILGYAENSTAVIDILTKLGLKKDSDPASSAVQKLVGSLSSAINKASGVKLDDKTFSSTVTKLLGNANIKETLEDAAGKGVHAFIKKAVAEYIS